MTAEELARLKHDVENLDECNHNYDVELARILNAAPALIARAEWAITTRNKAMAGGCNCTNESTCKLCEALAAYPEGE